MRIRPAIFFAILLAAPIGNLEAQIDSILLSKASPDQKYYHVTLTSDERFVIGMGRTMISAWKVESGEEVYSQPLENRNRDFFDSKNKGYFTNGADLLEFGKSDVNDDWIVRKIEGLNDRSPLSVSPDGNLLAFGTRNNTFGVYDMSRSIVLFQQEVGVDYFDNAAFSPGADRVTVLIRRDEDSVITYSVPDGKQIAASAAFIWFPENICYSPDGSKLAVSDGSDTTLLESTNLRPARGARFDNEGTLAWSGDGNHLVAGSVLYSVETRKRLANLRGERVSETAITKDGTKIFSAGGTGITIWDWRAEYLFRDAIRVFGTHPRSNESPITIEYSPDGKWLALAIPNLEYESSEGTREAGVPLSLDFKKLDSRAAYVFLINVADGKVVKAMWSMSSEIWGKEFEGFSYGVDFRNLAFSPDGKSLAALYRSEGRPGDFVVWDVSSDRPQIQRVLKQKKGTWRKGWVDAEFTEDGKSILLLPDPSGYDVEVLVFNLETAEIEKTVPGKFCESILVLPDGMFASGFSTWDYTTGDALMRETAVSKIIRTAANTISGVGRSAELYVWDLDTSRVVLPYAAHRGQRGDHKGIGIDSLASSPDGRIVATGCEDNLIRIWDTTSFRLLQNLRLHRHPKTERLGCGTSVTWVQPCCGRTRKPPAKNRQAVGTLLLLKGPRCRSCSIAQLVGRKLSRHWARLSDNYGNEEVRTNSMQDWRYNAGRYIDDVFLSMEFSRSFGTMSAFSTWDRDRTEFRETFEALPTPGHVGDHPCRPRFGRIV
ncbi:MAG: hypothetical protein O6942_05250 [Bacteroidetes bacterium]|nr:hypothetical protein [Bacteroidota bacterium]